MTSPTTPSTPSSSSTGSGIRGSRARTLLAAAAILVAGAALRFPGIDGEPEDWDAIDFALGVEDFDLVRYQPHFPGYPVYLFAARALTAAGMAPGLALEWAGSLAGTALGLVLFLLLRRPLGPRMAFLAGLSAAVLPPLAIQSVQAASDALGLLLAGACAALALGGRPFLAGAAFGLLLGARLSYAPLAPLLFLSGRAGGRWRLAPRLAGAAAGVLLWLLPLWSIAGETLWTEGLDFVRGHFTSWGGTAFSDPGESMLERTGSWMALFVATLAGGRFEDSGLRALGLAGAMLSAGGVAAAALGRRLPQGWRRGAAPAGSGSGIEGRSMLCISLALAAYAAWILVGQNPQEFRHLLPLHLAVAVLAALGYERLRFGAACMIAWTVASAVIAAAGTAAASGPPPASALADHLKRHAEDAGDIVYCGASYRFLQWQRADRTLRLGRARDFAGVVEETNSLLILPRTVYVTSEVEALPSGALALASFEKRGWLGVERIDLYAFRTMAIASRDEVRLAPRAPPRKDPP